MLSSDLRTCNCTLRDGDLDYILLIYTNNKNNNKLNKAYLLN